MIMRVEGPLRSRVAGEYQVQGAGCVGSIRMRVGCWVWGVERKVRGVECRV